MILTPTAKSIIMRLAKKTCCSVPNETLLESVKQRQSYLAQEQRNRLIRKLLLFPERPISNICEAEKA